MCVDSDASGSSSPGSFIFSTGKGRENLLLMRDTSERKTEYESCQHLFIINMVSRSNMCFSLRVYFPKPCFN